MRQPCAYCGSSFPAQRASAKYCSKKCNVAASRARTRSAAAPEPTAGALTVGRVQAELEKAGRDRTYLGAAALQLAARIDQSTAVMGFAALVKELRATMDAALAGVTVAADPVDELRMRRDRKRAG